MYEFMIRDKALGAYQIAFERSLELLAKKDPYVLAKNCGVNYDGENSTFTILSLGQELSITYPDGKISFKDIKKSPLWQWRLIILNHLSRGNNAPLSNRLISYRELEDGHVFYPAFYKNAIQSLARSKIDKNPHVISLLCTSLGGTLVKGADLAVEFKFLPRFPITLKIWEGDEEIAPSANILFDASANNYLHTEDIAVAGELVTTFFLELLSQTILSCD